MLRVTGEKEEPFISTELPVPDCEELVEEVAPDAPLHPTRVTRESIINNAGKK